MKNKLLEIFGVKNHKELYDYMESNPDDEKVIELKEIINMSQKIEENKGE